MTDLETYLAYYQTLDNPNFAVLVTGAWGSGKTHQVREALREVEPYYVSLFGVTSAEEAHDALLAAALPFQEKAGKAAQWVKTASESFGGIAKLGKLAPELVKAGFRRIADFDRIIIFDDLERCRMDLRDVMGIINHYVEHRGCRVIVIAHDDKIVEQFDVLQEKVIGQTLRIEPQTEAAFAAFAGELNNLPAHELIAIHRDTILSVFAASQCRSLRTLRHTLRDLVRLYDAMPERHRKSEPLLTELIPYFCALDIEVRSGVLGASDFVNRRSVFLAHAIDKRNVKGEKPETPALVIADRKYSNVDLAGTLIPDDLVIGIFVNGRYAVDDIAEALDRHPAFASPAKLPAWRVVWYFRRYPAREAERAMKKMEKQFQARKIVVPGEILHVCCLRMMLAERNIVSSTIDEALEEGIEYIDDLLSKGKMPPRPLAWSWESPFFLEHGGLGFYYRETHPQHFQKIAKHLRQAMEDALPQSFAKEAGTLLRYMRDDPQAFFDHLCHNNNGVVGFADVPILQAIEPEKFVSTWLRTHPSKWRDIVVTLEARYRGDALSSSLSDEKPWLIQVIKILKSEAAAADGFRRAQIEDAVLEGFEGRLAEECDEAEDDDA